MRQRATEPRQAQRPQLELHLRWMEQLPRVSVSSADWQYVLVEGGLSEALRWRHVRDGEGHLPNLFFPFDRSWSVTAA